MSDELNSHSKEDVEDVNGGNLVSQYSSLRNMLSKQQEEQSEDDAEEDEEYEESCSGDDSEDALGGTQKYSSLRKMMREDTSAEKGSNNCSDFLDNNNNTTNISNSKMHNNNDTMLVACDFPSSSDDATSTLEDDIIPDPENFHSYDPGTIIRLHDKATVMGALNNYWCPSIEPLCGNTGVVVRHQIDADASSQKLLFVRFEVKTACADDDSFLIISHTFPQSAVSFVSAPELDGSPSLVHNVRQPSPVGSQIIPGRNLPVTIDAS